VLETRGARGGVGRNDDAEKKGEVEGGTSGNGRRGKMEEEEEGECKLGCREERRGQGGGGKVWERVGGGCVGFLI